MKKHHRALLAIAAVFAVHLVAMIFFNMYDRYPSFDIVTHFAGGFAVGLLGLAIHDIAKKKYRLSDTAWWHDLLFVNGFVLLIAVLWEFHEFLTDTFLQGSFGYPISQLSSGDTMGDLFVGLLGGLVAFGVEGAGEWLEWREFERKKKK